MNKDVIYFITKEIIDLYNKLSLEGLIITIEERNKLINNLKELIKHEKEIYSYLTFDDVVEVRDYFDNNHDKIGQEISERVINKINEIIINNYFEEFSLQVNKDLDNKEKDIALDKSTVIYANSLTRDLFYLKIYFLNKFINNNGCIGRLYLHEFLLNQSKNSNIFQHCAFYPNIENELINNNFEVNDFYLNSNLVNQLSLFSNIITKAIKLKVLEEKFNDKLNIILTVNEDNLTDLNSCIKLIDSLIHILSTLMLEKDFLIQINKKFENIDNDLIYYLFYDNFNEMNNDKKNIKVLSLNNKFF